MPAACTNRSKTSYQERVEREMSELREHAERRAYEALAVREMGRDAKASAAARPTVELLRENERLRREVDEMRREGSRRANEVVAAMAAHNEEVRQGLHPHSLVAPDDDGHGLLERVRRFL